jgi:hypothetical protein
MADLFQTKIERLIHGYRRGHELLASSIRLVGDDSELVRRLSDLSGSISGEADFSNYLTVYPLPSRKYFALARTWPDRAAPRAGCVLTKTILVPMEAWRRLSTPGVLRGQLAAIPDRNDENTSSIRLAQPAKGPRLPADESQSWAIRDRSWSNFVSRYFSQGIRPLVWFNQSHAEEIVWVLLSNVWPALRGDFSACTLCFQPRSLPERSLDLMFAPSTAYSRFAKFERTHLIESHIPDRDTSEGESEWIRSWGSDLWRGRSTLKKYDLWHELDGDPTSIRRLYMLDEILVGDSIAPQIYVGALDLASSIAPSSTAACATKVHIVNQVLRAVRESQDLDSSLEALKLLTERVERNALAEVRPLIRSELKTTANYLTVNHFSEVTKWAGAEITDVSEENPIGDGIVLGIVATRNSRADLLQNLFREVPALVDRMFGRSDSLGLSLVSALLDRSESAQAREALTAWLEASQNQSARHEARQLILSRSAHEDLLTAALHTIRREELVDVFKSISVRLHGPGGENVVRALTNFLAKAYPTETKDWILSDGFVVGHLCDLLHQLYDHSRAGIEELIDDLKSLAVTERVRAVVLTNYLDDFSHGYPYWLVAYARTENSVFAILLAAHSDDDVQIDRQVSTLLYVVDSLPLDTRGDILAIITECALKPYFDALRTAAMTSVVRGYISGELRETAVVDFQNHPSIKEWFGEIESRALRGIIFREASVSRLHWANAWRWIDIAPTEFYSRARNIVADQVDALLRAAVMSFDTRIDATWTSILKRSRQEGRDWSGHLVLCVQSLHFAFEIVEKPLSATIVEVFPDVYAAVTESHQLPSEAAGLFGFFDWDRGKELRKNLVDAFLHSSVWRPGDLFLAADRAALTRKILSRTTRIRDGRRYVRLAIEDLEGRKRVDAASLATELRTLSSSHDLFEEWD